MIAAIGAFDGFHAGHRFLLEETMKLAQENKTDWAIVTFSPHPDVYFNRNAKLLLSEYEKYAEAKLLNIPKIICLPFGKIHNMHPEDFLEMLRKEYSINGIVVGKDFKFGYGADGDNSTIRNFCIDNNIIYSIVEVVKYSEGPEIGKKISTSVLREWFRDGKIEILKDALKFPCPISGIVVHGEKRGRKLGFPTVNILTPTEKMLPAEGVYAVSVLIGLEWRSGALFIGTPPMFKDVKEPRVEVHISNFVGDLYDKIVTVFLEEYVRPPMIFRDESLLARNIKLCVEKAALAFNLNHNFNNTLYEELLNAFNEITKS
jgi:riboflavin kinase/FMN adenylyltransferase